jgi:hypothetical protein
VPDGSGTYTKVLNVFALAASIVAWLQANQRKKALSPQVPKFNTGKKMKGTKRTW